MFGTRIREFRLQKGYSQKDLAKLLDVNVRTVSRWEQNTNRPNPEELGKIAKLIGISEEELFTDTTEDSDHYYDYKHNILDRISDSVDNLVTGQENINGSLLSNRDEFIRKQDEVIKELKSQNETLLVQISSYKKELNDSKADLRHKRIRTIIICITCLIVIAIVLGTWLYLRNYGIENRYYEGVAENGIPSHFEIDDGQ